MVILYVLEVYFNVVFALVSSIKVII